MIKNTFSSRSQHDNVPQKKHTLLQQITNQLIEATIHNSGTETSNSDIWIIIALKSY